MECSVCQAMAEKEKRPDVKDGKGCLNYFFSEFRPLLGLTPHGCNLMQTLKCGHKVPKHENQNCAGWARCGEDWKEKTTLGRLGKMLKGETL